MLSAGNPESSVQKNARVVRRMQRVRRLRTFKGYTPKRLVDAVRLTLSWTINWSILYPGSSVGNTSTFDVVEDTSSNLTSNVCLHKKACACVPTKKRLPGFRGIVTKLGEHVRLYTEIHLLTKSQRTRRSEGGRSDIRLTLGWAIDR